VSLPRRASGPTGGNGPYSVAIVTFRRPASLDAVLRGLASQHVRPGVIAVADNDPDESARPIVEEVQAATDVQIGYVPVGRNLGPAGGWARAADWLSMNPNRGNWLVVVDDDDPVAGADVLARLLEHAQSTDADVAAVGQRGAVLNRMTATLRRVRTPGRDVDYLASGGTPFYRWSTVDEVGFFDPELFFGFEDLDLGLRLTSAGYRLVVLPLPGYEVGDTSVNRSAWREYFKTRSMIVITRRHLGTIATFSTICRTAVIGAARLWAETRQPELIRARWRGVGDGIRGRLGPGDFAPGTNPPKPVRP